MVTMTHPLFFVHDGIENSVEDYNSSRMVSGVVSNFKYEII